MQNVYKEHDGEGGWIAVNLGFDLYFAKKSKQEPRFTITGESPFGWGCIHDEIHKHFPKYRNIIRWHLCGLETGPMHYIANALYLWGQIDKDPKALERFKSTIVFGAIDSDAEKFEECWAPNMVKYWLESRLPALLEVMESDLNKAGIPTVAAKKATAEGKE